MISRLKFGPGASLDRSDCSIKLLDTFKNLYSSYILQDKGKNNFLQGLF